MQLGREADLGVDDAVGREVLHALARRRARVRPCSASPRRCGRSPRGSARGRDWARRSRTTGRALRDRSSAGRRSRTPWRARSRSRGAARRRGGRAGGPSARGSSWSPVGIDRIVPARGVRAVAQLAMRSSDERRGGDVAVAHLDARLERRERPVEARGVVGVQLEEGLAALRRRRRASRGRRRRRPR